MVIDVSPELESALREWARRQGVAPEVLVLETLQGRFLTPIPAAESQDEWERQLRRIATDCGVHLPDEALSSEGIYD